MRQKKNIHGEKEQEEDDALGGAVTDSQWHVVFSSAAILPCAHHSFPHHPGLIPTQTLRTTDSRTKKN